MFEPAPRFWFDMTNNARDDEPNYAKNILLRLFAAVVIVTYDLGKTYQYFLAARLTKWTPQKTSLSSGI